MQDVPARAQLRGIAPGQEPVSFGEEFGILAQQGLGFLKVPGIVAAFLAFAIGVQAAVKPASRVSQFAQAEIQGFFRYPLEQGVAPYLPGMQIGSGEQGVIVEHFFKMRHQPTRIGAVAVKTAAHLVVDPAAGHGLQGVLYRLAGLLAPAIICSGCRLLHQKIQDHRLGEFRRVTKAAQFFIVVPQYPLQGLPGHRFVHAFRAGVFAHFAPQQAVTHFAAG